MKPVLTDGKLSVTLSVHEKATLEKACDIGVMLVSLHQDTGAPLVAAIEAILGKRI